MNAQKFTQKSLEAVQRAQELTLSHENQQMEQVHLLGALLEQDQGGDGINADLYTPERL